MVIFAILPVLLLLILLCLRGRTGHPDLPKLRQWNYAHRGLHGDGIPENSMESFRRAMEHGYGFELDVHLLSDGNLAVMHDSSLLRTTGQSGKLEALCTSQLEQYHLEGTEQTIPQFSQVLELTAGRVPMIVELKSDNNVSQLCEAVCRALEDYPGLYCIESFDPRCVRWMRKNRPDILRGQLAENFLARKSTLPLPLRGALSWNLLNFLTRPDFIAYRDADRKNPCNALCRKLWHIQGVSWTLRTPQDYQAAVSDGWIPIFEGFLPDNPPVYGG